jgi:hypothetical protein
LFKETDRSVSGNGIQYRAVSTALGASCNGGGGSATISELVISLGNNNALRASAIASNNDDGVASASARDASAAATSIARDTVANMNGSQTIVAVACGNFDANTRASAFGADDTGSDVFGWRVRIYVGDEIATNSPVNILAAKLEGNWVMGGTNVTTTLGATQGSNEADYIRAFTLPKGFRIYIGGRIDLTNGAPAGVVTSVLANEYHNTVNILGAISKGKNSTVSANICAYSGLTVDTGWTA